MDASDTIRVGGFTLNRTRGCLEDGAGAECFLRPKSYRVLELLFERRGELVSKDDLVRKAWPDVIVSDDSLAHCISEIRRAFGPSGVELLRTVPRRGYMLVEEDVPTRAPVQRWRAACAGGLVLTAVTASLGLWWQQAPAVPNAHSETTTSAMMLADELLDARDWQERSDNERARALLVSVVNKDPDDAEAWASLGLTYWLEVQHLAWGGGRREMTQASEMVERAMAIGGGARAHRLLAEMRLLAPFPEMRSPVDALANATAAVTIDPDDPDNLAVLAHVMALTGRDAEAVQTIERAVRLNPTPPDWYRHVAGLSYLIAGEPARAAEEFGTLHGAGTFTGTRWWPGWLFAASLAQSGRTEEAVAIVRAASGRRPERSVAAVAQSLDGWTDRASLDKFLDGLRSAGLPN
ncbi:tetratricopeptide repeat protein [uncultured Limimaricola sp.]|uniref:tetratricopeptide repeat protein n=1 Tax=uncultured Limimaricola sp. TaxID=2211667 RepID=UPI0030F5E472